MGVEETDAEMDEELLPQPPGLRRPARALIVLAGVALVGAGAVVALDRDPAETTRTPAASASRAEPPIRPVAAAFPTGNRDFTVGPDGQLVELPTATGRLAACPSGATCETDDGVPAAVRASVAAQFPGASVAAARTLVVRDGSTRTVLVGRIVEARTPDLAIFIEIRRPVPGDATSGSLDASLPQSARGLTGGYTVTVAVGGDSGSSAPVPVRALRTLVADRRLLAPPTLGPR